ncbi:glycosyl hydrolase, partial [bacterium]
RLGATATRRAPGRDALQATAFLNTDGTLAVVVMNESEKAMPFSLLVKGRAAPAEAPAHSIATYLVR